MEIRIKTAEEFRSSHVTIEIGTADMGRSGQTGNGWANVMMEQRDEIERLKAELSDEKMNRVANREWAERAEAHLDQMRAQKTDAVNSRDLALGELDTVRKKLAASRELVEFKSRLINQVTAQDELLREATHRLGEVQKIVNHSDVTSALDPAKATGAWGETLAEAIQQVRHTLVSTPSSDTSQA